MGSARQLQKDLERMADRADTSTPEGLHYVLQGRSGNGLGMLSARPNLLMGSWVVCRCPARLCS